MQERNINTDMSKKNNKNTKGKIVSAAWKLFYTQGYDDTTVEEIIEESKTSRGSFYHYFKGKDSLLSSLSYLFDEKYRELEIDESLSAFEKLMFLNQELFEMIDNSISVELLAQLYSSQLITQGEKHLLDHSRVYYKLLRGIVSDGYKNGEFKEEFTVSEIVRVYAALERSFIYEWCLSGGEYSLKSYAKIHFSLLFSSYKK